MSAKPFTCRICGSSAIEEIISLGPQPLANSLLKPGELELPESKFPLDVVLCSDCSLVQITETVPPETMFRNYYYFSSFSDTMLDHAKSLAGYVCKQMNLSPTSLVVEIGSNDGYLLQYYKERGVRVLGIDPAENVTSVAIEQKGIPTIQDFFSLSLAKELSADGESADVIHAHNVFAHVPDLHGVVDGIDTLLAPAGTAVIEAPYVKDLIDKLEFDTIYHEHLCYYSLNALKRLFENHGMEVYDIERIPIHGGSLRVYVGHANAHEPSERMLALLEEENNWGVAKPEAYLRFARDVWELKSSLRDMLSQMKRDGRRIAAYGAGAKATILLNFFGIGSEYLEYVVDRSTIKQGMHMPGVRLPIYPPEKLLDDLPDYALLLTWNFADEIIAQQTEYRNRGGRFIIPLPKPRIV